jgi:RHS repeat-associated protein
MAMETGGHSYYYTLDAQQSVLLLTDNTQTPVAAYTYDAWGNTTTATGSMATVNPWRYATGYYDTTTGYTKLGTRYYNTTTGTFTQPDPKTPVNGGYTYAADNPVNNVDPKGRDWIDTALGAVGTVSGVVATGAAAIGAEPVAGFAGAIAGGADLAKAGYDCVGGGDDSCGDSVASVGVDAVTFGLGRGLYGGKYQTVFDTIGTAYSLQTLG